jgi:hypothetical protein
MSAITPLTLSSMNPSVSFQMSGLSAAGRPAAAVGAAMYSGRVVGERSAVAS